MFRHNILKVALFSSVIFGCAVRSGKVTESRPFAQRLSNYKSVAISVTSSNPQGERYLDQFKALLSTRLRKSKVFELVTLQEGGTPHGADLFLKLDLFSVKEGKAFGVSLIGSNEAEFKFKGEMIEVSGKRSIASFETMGDSLAKSSWGTSGIQFSDSKIKRALLSACDKLIDYLKKNK